MPAAKIQHDVRLPILGQASGFRQCDVVVWHGSPPRQTITIVEVQKRNKKPTLAEFHGWCQKMRDVGAQHLICVSALGYPKSIIDDVARRHGPTVRLMTLAEVESREVADLTLLSSLTHRHPEFSFRVTGNLLLARGSESVLQTHSVISGHEAVFQVENRSERLSLQDLARIELEKHAAANPRLPDVYTVERTLPSGEGLWVHLADQRVQVKSIPLVIDVKTKVSQIPVTAMEYRQENVNGSVAWVMVATGKVGEHDVSIKVTFHKDEQGFLRIGPMDLPFPIQSARLLVSPDKHLLEEMLR